MFQRFFSETPVLRLSTWQTHWCLCFKQAVTVNKSPTQWALILAAQRSGVPSARKVSDRRALGKGTTSQQCKPPPGPVRHSEHKLQNARVHPASFLAGQRLGPALDEPEHDQRAISCSNPSGTVIGEDVTGRRQSSSVGSHSRESGAQFEPDKCVLDARARQDPSGARQPLHNRNSISVSWRHPFLRCVIRRATGENLLTNLRLLLGR